MLISYKHKFIFFANGKTGTTTIGMALLKYSNPIIGFLRIFRPGDKKKYKQHEPPIIVKNRISKKVWNSFFKFAFVRNPWDWVISHYMYNIPQEDRNILKFEKKHFDSFLKIIKKFKRRDNLDDKYQYNFLSDNKGEIMVDFVGKFENMQNDFNYICDKIGIEHIELPHYNKGKYKKKSYVDYYTEETKNLVAEKYKKDIRFFNYVFGK